jgi:hypothetical protein
VRDSTDIRGGVTSSSDANNQFLLHGTEWVEMIMLGVAAIVVISLGLWIFGRANES